jgi:RimJ/RimL family protein N-acetyltransferase
MPESTKLTARELSNRQKLPARMGPVTLTGSTVRLEPLDVVRDGKALFAVSDGEPIKFPDVEVAQYDADSLIWRYMNSGPFADFESFEEYLIALRDAANGLAMCVFDARTDRQVGVATYMNNFPEHLKVELGSIWYSPVVQGKGFNLESTYLMLKHAFELGYRRVEWKCNALNERSRRAALRMGFKFEGIQEFHFIIKGVNRDTAWFRMLDNEWTERKTQLESMIANQS